MLFVCLSKVWGCCGKWLESVPAVLVRVLNCCVRVMCLLLHQVPVHSILYSGTCICTWHSHSLVVHFSVALGMILSMRISCHWAISIFSAIVLFLCLLFSVLSFIVVFFYFIVLYRIFCHWRVKMLIPGAALAMKMLKGCCHCWNCYL